MGPRLLTGRDRPTVLRPTTIASRSMPLSLRPFIDVNVRASREVARALRIESDKPLWGAFERAAGAALAGLPEGATVLDLGGGRRCVYAASIPAGHRLRLVAVDVSAEELAANRDVDETQVADVSRELPFPDSSVDLILSRALLEHIDGVPAAVDNMARVLRTGARTIHLVPCRYSLFAIAARTLPFDALLNLLHRVNPGSRGQVEFRVFYDHCDPETMRGLFLAAGFREVTIDVTWAQPGYFETLLPLFLTTSLYEWVVRRLGIRRLAAYMVVSARL